MFSIRPLPEFTAWIDDLKDQTVRGVIAARIKRLELGLMGDVQPVGDGVSELRIHLGAGWRLYFTQRGTQIIVLLVGGSKSTQKKDIKRAKALAALLDWTEETIMTKRIKVADLPEFDAAHYLDSETSIAAYLTDILEANDASLLASALGDIARARGMTEIAKTAGITREALYKALRPDSAPRFDTVSRVCAALGVRLVAQPVHPTPDTVW
jgi:putative addiction module killer protein/probable addiction module antidote protein